MRRVIRRSITAGAMIGIVALATPLPPHLTLAHTPLRAASASGHPCAVTTGSGDTAFVKNFNPFGTPMDFTLGGIYEPLFIFTTAGGGHQYPWLATKYSFSEDAKTLFITIRKGVKWSDGKPFTPQDVVFTFEAGKINKAMDQINYTGKDTNIAKIEARGNVVAVHFKHPDVSSLGGLLSGIKIVPQHIWSKVKKPTTFTNSNPVGTGPYTRILKFTSQDYTFGKNPHYWQKGRPYVSCIERVSATGNDAAELLMAHGDVDWTGNFVANVQKVYVQKDPAHFHYFYATNQAPVGIFYDNTKYPWKIVNFRKAISMALDRDKISRIGEYGYAPPADAIGMKYEYPTWVDPKLEAASKKLVTYNVDAAKALLKQSGFTYDGSALKDPKGNRVKMQLDVPGPYTDWVLSCQIIEKNLKELGIDAGIKLAPDYDSWAAEADKSLVYHLHWIYSGQITPYGYFYSLLSHETYVKSGESAVDSGNWTHTWNPTAENLLHQFRSTTSTAGQKKIAYKLEKLMVDTFPYVPVFVGPAWYTYSTRHFTGWPTKQNFYAMAPVFNYPDTVVAMTRIKPIK